MSGGDIIGSEVAGATIHAVKYQWSFRFTDSRGVRFMSVDAPPWYLRLAQRVVLGIIWEREP